MGLQLYWGRIHIEQFGGHVLKPQHVLLQQIRQALLGRWAELCKCTEGLSCCTYNLQEKQHHVTQCRDASGLLFLSMFTWSLELLSRWLCCHHNRARTNCPNEGLKSKVCMSLPCSGRSHHSTDTVTQQNAKHHRCVQNIHISVSEHLLPFGDQSHAMCKRHCLIVSRKIRKMPWWYSKLEACKSVLRSSNSCQHTSLTCLET